MSLRLVAHKELRYALRTKTFWAVSTAFAVLVVGDAVLYTQQSWVAGTTADVVDEFSLTASALVPLVGLLVGYPAVVGERESGSLQLLLGLPHTRRDVVAGKLLGRSLVVALPLLASFAVAGVVVKWAYPAVSLLTFGLFALSTLLLAVTFVAIAVGISATTRTARRAGAAVIAVFVVARSLWGVLVNLLHYLKTGSASLVAPYPAWTHFVERLGPMGAFEGLTTLFLPARARVHLPGGADPPAYLSPWVSLLVLVVWATIPLAVGYWRFETADLA
jgi:ABC-2 type transport system permease protein